MDDNIHIDIFVRWQPI